MSIPLLPLGTASYDRIARMLRQADGQGIQLRAQTLRVLEFFIQNQGASVSKEAVMQSVWKGLAVTDDSLVQCIREIRQAIGDKEHSILQTVHRHGYRLNAMPNAAPPAELGVMPGVQPIALPSSTPPSSIPPSVLTGVFPPVGLPSALAVLPFSSVDGDERSERLAKAFSGDLLSKLSFNRDVPLISRHASFALQGRALTTPAIAALLKARYIVHGEVQVGTSSTQWSLEMLDGETNQVLWSENKGIDFSDVPSETEALMWRIAGSIRNNFRSSVLNQAQDASLQAATPFAIYSKALEVLARGTPESTVEAQNMAAALVGAHPQYPPAHIVFAHTHIWDMLHCATGLWKENRVAEVLAEIYKAIELNANIAWPFSLLAYALCDNGQFAEAEIAQRTSHKLGPSDWAGLTYESTLYFFFGRLDAALKMADRALEETSTHRESSLAARGRTLIFLDRRSEGIADLQECLLLTPGKTWARMPLIVALEETGEHAQAAYHFAELKKYTRNLDQAFFGRRWSRIPEIRDRYLKALGKHGLH
jgi:adenylate cyclase